MSGFHSDRLAELFAASDEPFLKLAETLVSDTRFPSYWHGIGFQYLGTLLVIFSRWLKKSTDDLGIRRIFFLARDGEVMKRVFTALYPDEASRCRYILCSRRLCANESCREDYIAYLKSEGFDVPGAGIVDVGRNGTMQRALESFFPENPIHGFYIDLRTSGWNFHGYFEHTPPNARRVLDFLDFLCISPSLLTVAIKRRGGGFKIETLDEDENEHVRHLIAADLQDGAEAFARAYRRSGETPPDPPQETIIEILNLLKRPTKADMVAMANVTAPFGVSNTKERYLVTPFWPWRERLLHPIAFFHAWRKRILR